MPLLYIVRRAPLLMLYNVREGGGVNFVDFFKVGKFLKIGLHQQVTVSHMLLIKLVTNWPQWAPL